jgi:hypothetical protein
MKGAASGLRDMLYDHYMEEVTIEESTSYA